MVKRYICFTCYKFHPEMRGVSEDEFNAGKRVCTQEKCTKRGQPLEVGNLCEVCDRIFPLSSNHSHSSP